MNGRASVQHAVSWWSDVEKISLKMLDYWSVIISLLLAQNILPIVAEQNSALLVVGKLCKDTKTTQIKISGVLYILNQIILFISEYSENVFMRQGSTPFLSNNYWWNIIVKLHRPLFTFASTLTYIFCNQTYLHY